MATSKYFAAPAAAGATPSVECPSSSSNSVLAVVRARKRQRGAPPAAAGDGDGGALTEMERQVVALRARHPDTLLLFECGYRMRLFAHDAEVAGRTLGISVAQYKSFRQASVPVHRALHHCRALVDAGHKVGIVRQVDTVAMRSARDGPQRPVLRREVVEVYTRATIPLADSESGACTEESEANVDAASTNDEFPASRFVLCVVEATVHRTTLFAKKLHELNDDAGGEKKRVDDVRIGLFAHDVHTGESLFDEFCDGVSRRELRDALARIEPVEFVLPAGGLSVYTEQLLQSYAHTHSSLETQGRREEQTQKRIRFESILNDVFDYESASAAFARFFDDAEREYSGYATRPRLPALCVCCFGGMQSYLMQFALAQSLASVKYASASTLSRQDRGFVLSSDCVRDLDIFRNSVDNKVTGSLFSILNHTRTDAGARKLRAWMSSPSVSLSEIEERQAAVQHLAGAGDGGAATSFCIVYEELVNAVLPKARPALRWISRVHTRKASPAQLVRGLERLAELEGLVDELVDLCSLARLGDMQLGKRAAREPSLLIRLLQTYPSLRPTVTGCLEEIDRDAATANDSERAILPRLRLDADAMHKHQELCAELQALATEFDKVLASCRAALDDPSLQFLSIQYGAGKAVHHLVSVEREQLRLVPSDWLVVNSTKRLVRFHPREIHQLHLREAFVVQRKAQLVQRAWTEFVASVDARVYVTAMECVEKLASLDVLCSLATVARTQPGYTLPTVVPQSAAGGQVLKIVSGRNAILDTTLSGAANMGNSVTMTSSGDATGSALVVSGPNMGGKSSLLRMCALIVVMAQTGSYVPAAAARLSLFDGIFSRMHRSSSSSRRAATAAPSMRSSEMEALTVISRRATRRSLVLIDEIGFGLTAAQARAVAFGLVTYLVETVGCHVLFATHMAAVAQRLTSRLRACCQTKQLGVSISGRADERQQVFHYTLTDGVASDSFALHAARLAGVPADVVRRAAASMATEVEDVPSRVTGRS